MRRTWELVGTGLLQALVLERHARERVHERERDHPHHVVVVVAQVVVAQVAGVEVAAEVVEPRAAGVAVRAVAVVAVVNVRSAVARGPDLGQPVAVDQDRGNVAGVVVRDLRRSRGGRDGRRPDQGRRRRFGCGRRGAGHGDPAPAQGVD